MAREWMRLLLMGPHALPEWERWLLAWLVDAGSDRSVSAAKVSARFIAVSGMTADDLDAMSRRWRRLGLLGYVINARWSASTDAVALVHAWQNTSALVDLDAMELVA